MLYLFLPIRPLFPCRRLKWSWSFGSKLKTELFSEKLIVDNNNISLLYYIWCNVYFEWIHCLKCTTGAGATWICYIMLHSKEGAMYFQTVWSVYHYSHYHKIIHRRYFTYYKKVPKKYPVGQTEHTLIWDYHFWSGNY